MNFQTVLGWIQKSWQTILWVIAVIIVFWFGGLVKSCTLSYIKHKNDPVTSNPEGTLKPTPLTDPTSDVDVLKYAQDWLNLKAPYVLSSCYPNHILVKDCVGEQKK